MKHLLVVGWITFSIWNSAFTHFPKNGLGGHLRVWCFRWTGYKKVLGVWCLGDKRTPGTPTTCRLLTSVMLIVIVRGTRKTWKHTTFWWTFMRFERIKHVWVDIRNLRSSWGLHGLLERWVKCCLRGHTRGLDLCNVRSFIKGMAIVFTTFYVNELFTNQI